MKLNLFWEDTDKNTYKLGKLYKTNSLFNFDINEKGQLSICQSYDKSREEQVHAKVNKLAEDLNIDKSILSDIMDMLTTLSKNRQREILEE